MNRRTAEGVIGGRARAKIVKNKVAAPFRVAEFDMMFVGERKGISREGDILDLGVEYEIVKKSGAFYSYNETRLGQGRENSKSFLFENSEMAEEIEAAVREAAGLEPLQAPVEGAEEERVTPQPKPIREAKSRRRAI